MSYQPIGMYHPNHVPAVISADTFKDGQRIVGGEAKAEVFPVVTVSSQDDEDYHRSLGYLPFGESPVVFEGEEYPKWMFKDGSEKLVDSEEQQAELGEGWSETP